MTNSNSLNIILRQFKEGHLTEEEAVTLIEELSSKWTYSPNITPWPQITYTQQYTDTFPKYEVTCNVTK